MKVLVGDFEANGLLDDVTKIWCGVFRELNTNNYWLFDAANGAGIELEDFVRYKDVGLPIEVSKLIEQFDYIIIHNGVGYDNPMLSITIDYTIPDEKLIDSFIWSKMLYPDIKSPSSMPKRVKPHSLEAYGERLGIKKLPDLDWKRYSSGMIARCKTDVDINHDMFLKYIYPEIKDEIPDPLHEINYE